MKRFLTGNDFVSNEQNSNINSIESVSLFSRLFKKDIKMHLHQLFLIPSYGTGFTIKVSIISSEFFRLTSIQPIKMFSNIPQKNTNNLKGKISLLPFTFSVLSKSFPSLISYFLNYLKKRTIIILYKVPSDWNAFPFGKLEFAKKTKYWMIFILY